MDTLARYKQLSADLEKQLENLNAQITTISEMKIAVDQTIELMEEERGDIIPEFDD